MTERDKVIKGLECCAGDDVNLCYNCPYLGCSPDRYCFGNMAADALALLKAQEPITGETSDGYHTFNELYHHRAVLFSVIVANCKDRAWKSVRHHDGTMYDGMFIVGIDTPDGQATYHYDINPYWDMFDCKVREFAPEWDGHTPTQAIERIGRLKAQEPMVLKLKELEDWDSAVFFEAFEADMYYAIVENVDLTAGMDGGYVLVNGVPGEYHRRIWGGEHYGKTWRCWTSRPDEKRRAETPWEQ